MSWIEWTVLIALVVFLMGWSDYTGQLRERRDRERHDALAARVAALERNAKP